MRVPLSLAARVRRRCRPGADGRGRRRRARPRSAWRRRRVHGGDVTGPARRRPGARLRRRAAEATARRSAGARSTSARQRHREPARASSAARTTSPSATSSSSRCPGRCCPAASRSRARKTYGHVSDGMICSARELGLGDDHDGHHPARRVGPGRRRARATTRSRCSASTTQAVEVNVTPDRGYALRVRGVAREYAHATGAAFTDPALLDVPGADDRRLRRSGWTTPPRSTATPAATASWPGRCAGVDPAAPVAALDAAPAAAGRDAADLAGRRRDQLRHARARPAAARLRPGPAARRRSSSAAPRPGERLTTLDGVDRALRPRGPADHRRRRAPVLALAGVMGGADHRGRRPARPTC